MESALISFDCQAIITLTTYNYVRNVCLGAHGINRNDTLTKVQLTQEARNGSNFIAFILNSYLTKANPITPIIGSNNMSWGLVSSSVPPNRFAINRDQF